MKYFKALLRVIKYRNRFWQTKSLIVERFTKILIIIETAIFVYVSMSQKFKVGIVNPAIDSIKIRIINSTVNVINGCHPH